MKRNRSFAKREYAKNTAWYAHGLLNVDNNLNLEYEDQKELI
jgi:hypothetical protein